MRSKKINITTTFPAGQLPKSPTGIQGFDEITQGGLPAGRPTLVAGSAGAGKTLFAMEFLVNGATKYNEPGVFVTFEETKGDLVANVKSLGFDLDNLIEQKKLYIDHVVVEKSEIEETGDYDLEGLFIRLGFAIDSIKAKRIVLDTIETLFSGLSNQAILRSELRRLFHWLKEKGVTAIITGERGDATITRQGLEEYVSDAVIILDHRINDQISTRRLRVVKYRGSTHGTNEYPFLIDDKGFSVLPITSLGLRHTVTNEYVSTGIPRLDTMLGGKGLYKGSTIIITGTAGSGKSTISASMTEAACKRGERVVYFASEESPDQIIRNMKTVGIDLKKWVDKGLLEFHASRATEYGLEVQLVSMVKTINEFKPQLVVFDPITTFTSIGTEYETKSMLTRLVDFVKGRQITGVFTSLTDSSERAEKTEADISSLIDSWILVRFLETNGERNRGLFVLKSRGMPHSHQIREFKISSKGIELTDVYIGPQGILAGSARVTQQAQEKALQIAEREASERKKRDVIRRKKAFEAKIAALRAEFEADIEERMIEADEKAKRDKKQLQDKQLMAEYRGADAESGIIEKKKTI